ncbi:AAA family ATPase [Streptomyces sp. ID01-12c]|uniref:helix-turn-helix transcriptional regulator n=1 Tax=Streptomyces caniscabiei TaxID=2746961 RepID=UPI00177B8E0C|nr:helix-turn-helix transcriptional regulator [Streptomyces caniscabiei]MBD9703714.1 AAA family ATPase [Streptomyces caniscabiei]MDX3733099.1 AAA family ATPase [Streptomyces caniscabiei]
MAQSIVHAPFVGRDTEMARLRDVLDRAGGGEPRAVLVAGDAGVGKSRTLAEAAAYATRNGTVVFTGHCVDLGDVGLPYLPFTEILGALAADERFAPLLEAHPATGRLLGGGADGGDRLQLFEGVAALLTDLTSTTPVLLVLEDLHWADQSSRDLLRFLLSRAVLQRPTPGAPVHRLAVFASYRADDLHRRHPLRPLLAELVRLPAVERLELRPMPDTEVARLVRSLRAEPLPEATVGRIVERAEGNAFYAEELLAATADEPGAVLPSGLADVLLIRIEQLPGAAQQVLRTASVAGRRVEHDLLRDAVQLPDDELESALREAVGRQLLLPGEGSTYEFRHALTREAVYADLLPGERVRLHGVFAKLLARRGRAGESAERAHHSRESHDLADALAASVEAADHAHGVGAPAEELRQLEGALELWSSVDAGARPRDLDTVTLTLRASAAAARAGENHRAVSLSRSALAGAGPDADSELAARVRYTLAGDLMRVDHLEAAFRYSSEALVMIPVEPPSRTWVWAAATHVMAARYVGQDEEAGRVAGEALDVAERLGLADARADLIISVVGLDPRTNRRTAPGRARLCDARDLARGAGNVPVEMRALFNLAVGCFESGDLDACLGWLAEGLERAGRAGLLSSPYPVEMRYLHSLCLYTLGRWDECVRSAADADRLPADAGYAVGPALYVALARGDESAVDRARALLEGRYDFMAALVAGVTLAEAALLRRDPHGAVAQFRKSVSLLTEQVGARPDATVRLAALALGAVADAVAERRSAGDEEEVRRWAATGEELVRAARDTAAVGEDGGGQGPEGLAWLARAEAEWTRVRTGPEVDVWRRAVDAFAFGDPYESARCRLRLAEALLAAGAREEAAAEARVVAETADRLGAVPLRAALDALVRRGRLGETRGDGHVPALTARESDVLRLLALGRTNRQIGEELFITGKTASVHVSNILAKLGAASRTEAVAIAYRQGLITTGSPT